VERYSGLPILKIASPYGEWRKEKESIAKNTAMLFYRTITLFDSVFKKYQDRLAKATNWTAIAREADWTYQQALSVTETGEPETGGPRASFHFDWKGPAKRIIIVTAAMDFDFFDEFSLSIDITVFGYGPYQDRNFKHCQDDLISAARILMDSVKGEGADVILTPTKRSQNFTAKIKLENMAKAPQYVYGRT
jgi:hypothetical protein